MRETTLKEVKNGEFFTFKPNEEPNENIVWVKDGYDRSIKKYICYKWADVNHYAERKGTTTVYVDFTF